MSLLINRDWVDAGFFDGFALIDVDPAEPAAENVVRVGSHVICAAEHLQTRRRLEAQGFVTLPVPAAEFGESRRRRDVLRCTRDDCLTPAHAGVQHRPEQLRTE